MTRRSLWPELRQRFRLAGALACTLLGLAAPGHAAVVVSQVYGGGGNSGATLQHDFIEIFNNGTAAESVGGWSVQYASATGTTWQVTAIPAGTTLQPGRYLLIRQAAGTGGTVPVVGDVTGNIAMAAASGKVALASSSTALSGAAPSGGSVKDIVSYGSATPTEGTPTALLSNTTAALRKTGGCTDANDNSADFSVGTPAPRSGETPANVCGGGGGSPLAKAIYDIQGSGAVSPYAGQAVITSGVVTLLTNNGFFIQDLLGDGNPATSDGIFVFASPSSFPAAQVGNLVQVTGTVVEFSSGAGTAATPLTELGSVTDLTFLGSGYSMAPTPVTLPLEPGDSFERFEGMLVRITNTMTVQQNFYQARYGQVTIGVGRHETPTNRYRPGTPQALALDDLQSRSRLLLDDGSSVQNPKPTPYFLNNGVPRAGDSVANLTGVIDFGLATSTASGAGLYRLQPTTAPQFGTANPRPPESPAVGGTLRVGAMNVLNFFTTFTNGQSVNARSGQGCALGGSVSAANCRGADSPAEYVRQRDKLVRQMAGLNADALGLMETQNNGNFAAQVLVDALNAFVGAGTYATIAVPAAGTGTDAIRVAMIYKPARLTPVGLPQSDTADINNRPTLAQTFATTSGQKFSLVVNHLKSKSSCPSGSGPDADNGQGCWNATRVAQAQRLRTFVAQVQAASGVEDVLLVGDFNAYAQEDPIVELTSNGYVDQIGRYNDFGYSYVFDGTAGRLDHAIASASLSARITGAAEWHINADEQVAYDYNLEFKQPACATCAPDPYDGSVPYRASDHDPVIVGLDLSLPARGKARAATAPARPPAAAGAAR